MNCYFGKHSDPLLKEKGTPISHILIVSISGEDCGELLF